LASIVQRRREVARAWFADLEIGAPGIPILAPGAVRIPLKLGAHQASCCTKRGVVMDSALIVRIVAGVLVVVILAVLIQRRRTKVK
jgi:hypothetical protein